MSWKLFYFGEEGEEEPFGEQEYTYLHHVFILGLGWTALISYYLMFGWLGLEKLHYSIGIGLVSFLIMYGISTIILFRFRTMRVKLKISPLYYVNVSLCVLGFWVGFLLEFFWMYDHVTLV